MQRFFFLLLLCSGTLYAQTPGISAILNNYSRIPRATANYGIAQGSIFIVQGANLADTSTTLQDVTPGLQTTLHGVRIRITVNGVTAYAPLYYVLPEQVAGVLPSNVPVGTGTVVVENNGRNSDTEPIKVVASAFGILTFNYEQGTGRAIVHSSSYTLLGSANSTHSGNEIVFYGSGLGPSSPGTDETHFLTPRKMTEVPISFTIGGVPAEVTYHGRTIYPGLDQVNVKVPALNANQYGCDVAVVVTVNGVLSNSVTIPIADSGTDCPAPLLSGSNTAVAPSQTEINAWAAAGIYRTGAVSLTRTTQSVTWDNYVTGGNSNSVTEIDQVDAVFSRITGADLGKRLRKELPPGYPNLTPAPGSCVGYSLSEVAAAPYNVTVKNLDAGAAVTSHGPNGAQVAARQDFAIEGFTYSAGSIPNTYLAPGRYFFEAAGGADVGALSGSLEVAGADLEVTNPTDLQLIDRVSGAVVRWKGGDPGAVVTIAGESKYIDLQLQEYVGAGFVCTQFASAGEFRIPAGILTRLPVSETYVLAGFIAVSRGTLSISSPRASTRLTAPNGLDILTADYTRVWTFTPQYD